MEKDLLSLTNMSRNDKRRIEVTKQKFEKFNENRYRTNKEQYKTNRDSK